MSGEGFSHRVRLRLDGRDLAGCGRPLRDGEMTEKYWKLVELEGKPAVAPRGAREPHLRLRREGGQALGSTGCNGFNGQYQRDGDRIRFGRMITTLMACADTALAAQEREFLGVLERADRAAVVSDRLTLYAADRPLARFVAVYLR